MTVKLGTADIAINDAKLVVTRTIQDYLRRKGEVTEGEAVTALEVSMIMGIAALEARINAVVEGVGGTMEVNPTFDPLDALRNDEI